MLNGRNIGELIALIPAYNEAEGIAAVVRTSLKHLPTLVVDDGSTDDTVEQVERVGELSGLGHELLGVLRQMPNQGKGAALKAGFSWMIERGYGGVVTLDGDGQHDPDEIPKFLQTYQETGADLIIGQRNFSQMPLIRRLANILGWLSFSWAMGTSIPDNQSGYRLLSRRLIQAVLESEESGFEYEVEMISTCVRRGFLLSWVPIRTIYASEGSHIRPYQHVRNFVRMLRKTRWG